MRSWSVALAVVVAAVTVGCSGGETPEPSEDLSEASRAEAARVNALRYYVDEVLADPGAAAPLIDQLDNDTLVAVGQAACQKLDEGFGVGETIIGLGNYTQTADGVAGEGAMQFAAHVLRGATGHLCPEHVATYEAWRSRDDRSLGPVPQWSRDDFVYDG